MFFVLLEVAQGILARGWESETPEKTLQER